MLRLETQSESGTRNSIKSGKELLKSRCMALY